MENKTFTVCSLFAGIGGIDLAFRQTGFQIVFANEFDKDACSTYLQNFPSANLVCEDIKKIDAFLIPNFDVLVAGFPCQAFSVCGYQKGFADERGNLFFEICRILEAKQPRAVFLENVANLVKHDDGKTFTIICNSLTELGYHVRYSVMDACEYGVPQHRTRTYIVAFRDDELANEFAFPKKQTLNKHIFDIIDKTKPAEDKLYLIEGSVKYRKMAAAIDDTEQIYRFSDYGVQKGKDGISFTLKANMGVWYNREPIIKDIKGIRKLSPKECLLLQGFPGDYQFPNISAKSAYKQAGNTVCVPVVKQIADEIYKTLSSGQSEQKVLIGVLRNKTQLEACLEFCFYHMPVRKLKNNIDEITHVALLQTKGVFGNSAGVEYYGRVQNITKVKRSDITEIPKTSDEEYYYFKINQWDKLPKAKDIKFTGEFILMDFMSLAR